MEELIFSKLQKGDVIATLERDRRSGYPIFDKAKVIRVGESKPMSVQGKEGFVNNVEIQIQDSVSTFTVYLPTNSAEGIYNGVYYTTNISNIVNELQIQRQQALNILNNKDKYEAVVAECEAILSGLESNQPSIIPAAPEFEEFKSVMSKRMDDQEALLLKIAQELVLGNKKQQ